MRDKIFSIAFSVIFIFLLAWCPAAFVLDKLNIAAIPENKNIKLPEKFYEGAGSAAAFLNSLEEGKASLENIYSNCLPMYENITMLMFDSERAMNDYLLETLYSWEDSRPPAQIGLGEAPGGNDDNDNSDNTGEPGGETPGVADSSAGPVTYKARRIGTDWQNKVWAFAEEGQPFSSGWTDKTLLADEFELRRRVDIQTGHVNRIANANKDVNFYVYVCSRFQETELFGEIIKDIRIMQNEFSTFPIMMEFFDLLDKSAVTNYDYFKIDPLELRLERIFKTDHHESAQGAYSIYQDVINMMAKDSPVLGEPREATFHVIDGLDFRGSHVWNFGYTEIRDDWHYYKIDLPERILFENIDGTGNTRRNIERYEAGRFARDTFADHYYHFYPRIGSAEYPGNSTGRNLLMLTDSYSWATSELISSHFDRTYATLWTHGRFDYNNFIRDNNITDVLILQVADRILYDIQNDTQLDKVITD